MSKMQWIFTMLAGVSIMLIPFGGIGLVSPVLLAGLFIAYVKLDKKENENV